MSDEEMAKRGYGRVTVGGYNVMDGQKRPIRAVRIQLHAPEGQDHLDTIQLDLPALQAKMLGEMLIMEAAGDLGMVQ